MLFLQLIFLLTLPLSVRFGLLAGMVEEHNILIMDLYSCDRLGYPQDYFPIKTTAYFNIGARNLSHESKNITINLSVRDELNVPIGLSQLNTTIFANTSEYYIIDIFIPKWAARGLATAYASVLIGEIIVDSASTNFEIGPEDLTPPALNIISPDNKTYEGQYLPLVFTINERAFWMGFSLDDSKYTSILANETITCLTNGSHSIVVCANDTSGNVGFSEKVYFTTLIIHDVALKNFNCSFTQVYEGQTISITCLLQNEGNTFETVNVTVYANSTVIEMLTIIDLPQGNQTTIAFLWNTTSFVKGHYTIWAYAWPVPGETDIADNTFTDGTILVTILGDINGDRFVNIKDVILLGVSFNSQLGDDRWSPLADLNCDNFINIMDAVILNMHFAQSW